MTEQSPQVRACGVFCFMPDIDKNGVWSLFGRYERKWAKVLKNVNIKKNESHKKSGLSFLYRIDFPAILRHKLIIVFRQPYFVHLAGFSQTLKLNLVFLFDSAAAFLYALLPRHAVLWVPVNKERRALSIREFGREIIDTMP